MQTISPTDLAKNTLKILDQVASQREIIAVECDRILIARIVPPEQTMTASQALAGLSLMLTRKQGAAWLKDSKGDFDQSVRDPWESSSIAASG